MKKYIIALSIFFGAISQNIKIELSNKKITTLSKAAANASHYIKELIDTGSYNPSSKDPLPIVNKEISETDIKNINELLGSKNKTNFLSKLSEKDIYNLIVALDYLDIQVSDVNHIFSNKTIIDVQDFDSAPKLFKHTFLHLITNEPAKACELYKKLNKDSLAKKAFGKLFYLHPSWGLVQEIRSDEITNYTAHFMARHNTIVFYNIGDKLLVWQRKNNKWGTEPIELKSELSELDIAILNDNGTVIAAGSSKDKLILVWQQDKHGQWSDKPIKLQPKDNYGLLKYLVINGDGNIIASSFEQEVTEYKIKSTFLVWNKIKNEWNNQPIKLNLSTELEDGSCSPMKISRDSNTLITKIAGKLIIWNRKSKTLWSDPIVIENEKNTDFDFGINFGLIKDDLIAYTSQNSMTILERHNGNWTKQITLGATSENTNPKVGHVSIGDDPSSINDIVISDDKKTIITTGNDNRILVWQKGKDNKWLKKPVASLGGVNNQFESLGHTSDIDEVGISKDGNTIISSDYDSRLLVWHKDKNGKWHNRPTQELQIPSDEDNLFTYFSLIDGGKTVVSYADKSSKIYIWQELPPEQAKVKVSATKYCKEHGIDI